MTRAERRSVAPELGPARHRSEWRIRTPLIVDIKRHSLEDGPGIRSVVFFKGCPLRCSFCQNPETQDATGEIAFSPQRCIDCGRCVEACEIGAVTRSTPTRILRQRCTRCGRCADACTTGAMRLVGVHYSVEALAEVLLRDAPYYRHSNGGVTISGGECTLYPDYLRSLLKFLKGHGIHVILQTCGQFHYETFQRKLLPHVDLIYFDVKLADPSTHRRHTGKPNQTILANLRRLLRTDAVTVRPRVPLVPAVTATKENLTAIVDLLCDAGARSVTLLPYNPIGLDMYAALGRPRPRLPDHFTKPDELQRLRQMFERVLARKAASPNRITNCDAAEFSDRTG